MNRDDMLRQAIEKNTDPVYLKSYADIKESFREKYGERNWKGKLAEAYAGRQAGVKAKDDKPYLAARRSIERYEKGQFQTMRKYGKETEAIGKKLDPIGRKLRNNELTLTIKGTQQEKRYTREREITHTMTGSAAQDFINDPSYADWYDDYMPDGADLLDDDGSYAIDVYAVA